MPVLNWMGIFQFKGFNPKIKKEKNGTKKERVIMNQVMTRGLEMRLEEMKKFAAELEQGSITWENACGYSNEELLPFLNLATEGEYV